MATVNSKRSNRTRTIVLCALSVAIMAVSAWITVPFGAVPFTLQTLAVAFVLFALTPSQALISIACYILLGAIGLPVFSSFRGGLSTLLGPTGGFIYAFFIGGALALGVAALLSRTNVFASDTTKKFFGTDIRTGFLARNILVGVIFIIVVYLLGWIHLMVVGSMTPEAAFVAAVGPFIPADIVKIIFAIVLAQVVCNSLGQKK